MQDGDNAGKVAVVTGAASGIGAATAEALARSGATVAAIDIAADRLDRVCKDLAGQGLSCEAIVLDMADHPGIAAAAQGIVARHGGIDLLVNCAAKVGPEDGKVDAIDAATWMGFLAANLVGPALLARAALPAMLARGGGAMVHVASAAGLRGEDTRTCYGAAKAGLMALSRSIATQYGKQGVRSNAIAPGLIMTPAARRTFDPDLLALLESYHQTPQLGEPDDVAEAILFLLSPAARFINGHTLVNDGGFTTMTPIVPAFRAAGL